MASINETLRLLFGEPIVENWMNAKTFAGKVKKLKKERPDIDDPDAYVAATLRKMGEDPNDTKKHKHLKE